MLACVQRFDFRGQLSVAASQSLALPLHCPKIRAAMRLTLLPQVNVVLNAIVADCASDPVGASSQLFIRNYYLNADSRAMLSEYTNVSHYMGLRVPHCCQYRFRCA